jgi:hypothetical protein
VSPGIGAGAGHPEDLEIGSFGDSGQRPKGKYVGRKRNLVVNFMHKENIAHNLLAQNVSASLWPCL